VFTSKVDRRETAMAFKDYTLREKEIHQSMSRALGKKVTDAEEMRKWKSRVPKRLRGATITLVDRLRTLNYRCSYTELLRHYCPVKVWIVASKLSNHTDRDSAYLFRRSQNGENSIFNAMIPQPRQ
jgi:telomerase reverse transcriptase